MVGAAIAIILLGVLNVAQWFWHAFKFERMNTKITSLTGRVEQLESIKA